MWRGATAAGATTHWAAARPPRRTTAPFGTARSNAARSTFSPAETRRPAARAGSCTRRRRRSPPCAAAGAASRDHALAIGLAFMRYNAVNAQRETEMPEIYVHAVKGRTLDQKRALIKDITDAVVKNFSVPVEAVTIEIVESEPTAKAKGGVLFSEMRR
jgi:4-oxalocrotonate tautomerase